MPSLEQLKDRVEEEASENPERFFAVEKIEENGFHRKKCANCGKYFWTVNDRDVCGEPACGDGYTFINDSPTEKKFSFESAWKEFSEFMDERGYTPIDRYPVAARWRSDTDFVRASIYDFQPYVVSGEVEPPANPLVVPQFCVRFNDIDNVGITGRHYTGFVMIGQHAFTDPEDYDQDKYFEDMLDWIIDGMGIPKEKVILHEDSWGGGGNLGACMEFFVDGLELFNQVYMFYRVDSSAEKGYSELDTKVLDMGMGHERIVWITHGSETSYEANMEKVVNNLYEETGVEPDREVWRKFLPYSSLLNMDEVDDIEETWNRISDETGINKYRLKKEVKPAAALYSIADHTRSLLVALNDKILPSNSGEAHSLRVIARRCFDFIDKYDWDIDINQVMEWHAEEMEGVFPELKENLDQVKRIMDNEREKFQKMRDKAEKIVEKLDEDDIDREKLLELYDSEGISPEMLQRMGLDIEVPSDFYSRVSKRHEEEEKEAEEKEDGLDVDGLEKTEKKYFEDEKKLEFDGKVEKMIEKNGEYYAVLESTYFYPTSGGQLHDIGEMDGVEVVDVSSQAGVILHKLGEEPGFSEGDEVECRIDRERRKQLMQHHSATHLINAAAGEVLGSHVMQAGAKKTEKKARLDITHFKKVSREELQKIEDRVNEWIEEAIPVEKTVMDKSEAEQKYGFSIYQGGVPPGSSLRIVNVGDDMDVEACGGTHVENTSEIEKVVLTNTKKVQDGIIRLEYKAGEAAEDYMEWRENLQEQLERWIDTEDYTLEQMAEIFQVEVDELSGVVQRFVDEWNDQKKEVWELEGKLEENIEHNYDERPRDPEELFQQWKRQRKEIDSLGKKLEQEIKEELLEDDSKMVERRLQIDDVGTLIRIVQDVTREETDKAVILRGNNAVVGCRGEESDAEIKKRIEEQAEVVQESGNLVKGFKLKY